jgi:hypothetical protein
MVWCYTKVGAAKLLEAVDAAVGQSFGERQGLQDAPQAGFVEDDQIFD